jgi:hypothetical protein
VGGDAGEHQFTAPLLGIPHATGYPLYVLLGKLWTLLLPAGSLAWRMNLFSAAAGALAAAVTSLVVYRLLLSRRPGRVEMGRLEQRAAAASWQFPAWLSGLVAGLVLAFGLTLWHWSTIAGVRSLNVLFFALLTLEAIIWQQQRQQGQDQAADRTLRWLALTIGLSLAHHRTTLFYLPSLAGWILWHDRRLLKEPRRLLVLLLLAAAPLSLYLFTYWRGTHNPPYSHEQITGWQSFWFLVGAGDSSGLFLSMDPVVLPARLAFIWRDLLAQFSLPGVLLSGLGGLLLLRRQAGHFLMQGLLVLLLGLFTLDFEVVNLNEAPTWYLMPAFFILAVWIGVGIHWLFTFESRFLPEVTKPLLPFLTAFALLALFVYSLARPNWQHLYTLSTTPLDEWRQLLRGAQAQRFVESSLPYLAPDSLILTDWEQYTPFKYYQLINGWRPDVVPRLPLDRWPEQVAAAHAAGQPVYLARKTTDLIGTPYLSMAGPLIHLGLAPHREIPADIIRLEASFENELELIGYRAELLPQATPGGHRAGPILQVLLYWRVSRPVQWDYALSLRLLDPAGRVVHQQDVAHPVLSSYPTSLWTPGEVVADFYELPFPAGSGRLTLHVLPYRSEGPGQWHNLTLSGTNPPQEGIMLGPFEEK